MGQVVGARGDEVGGELSGNGSVRVGSCGAGSDAEGGGGEGRGSGGGGASEVSPADGVEQWPGGADRLDGGEFGMGGRPGWRKAGRRSPRATVNL